MLAAEKHSLPHKVRPMRAYRVETVLGENGRIALDDLPFDAGQRVEIIVLSADPAGATNPYPLRDLPYSYDDPFGPLVAPEDWDAMK
jgi:hypothetical protein